MALDILVFLQGALAGAMVAILVARFLLPIRARDAIMRVYHHVLPTSHH